MAYTHVGGWERLQQRSIFDDEGKVDMMPPASAGPSRDSTLKIQRMAALLSKKLGPEYLSTRAGGNAGKMTYIEGWRVIALANEVFGFNGWSSEIKDIHLDFCDINEESQRFSAAVTARVRVTLSDGCYHEDVGIGKIENCKSKADAIDKIKKEAVTDALKRALRNFGNLLGNCLYDKNYLENISKVKPPAKPKLDFSEMHRPGQIYDDDGRVIKLDAAAVAAGQAGAGTDAVADPIAGPSKVADTYAAAGPRGQAPQQAQRAAATMRSIPSNGDASANNRSGVPLVPTTRHGLLNGAANGARVVAVQAENSQSMFDGFVDENASGVTAGNAADDSGYQEGDFSVLDVKPSLVADKIVPIAFGKDWDSATRAGNRATVADGDVRGAASHAAGRPSMGQADGSQAASAPQNRQELQKQADRLCAVSAGHSPYARPIIGRTVHDETITSVTIGVAQDAGIARGQKRAAEESRSALVQGSNESPSEYAIRLAKEEQREKNRLEALAKRARRESARLSASGGGGA